MKKLTTRATIELWLVDHATITGEATVLANGKVRVIGGFSLGQKMQTLNELNTYTELPFEFESISGPVFIHNWPNLQTLSGLPEHLQHLEVTWSGITNLAGAPSNIDATFRIAGCPNLTSLQGAPATMGDFLLQNNQELSDLSCTTTRINRLNIQNCPKVYTLAGMNAAITKRYTGRSLTGASHELVWHLIQNKTTFGLDQSTPLSRALTCYRKDNDVLRLMAALQAIRAYQNFCLPDQGPLPDSHLVLDPL